MFGVRGIHIMTSAAALLIGGCSVGLGLFLAKEDIVEYREHGVAFSHSDAWTATAETETIMGVELAMITIDGPESALVMIQHFQPPVPVDTDEMMTSFTAEVRTNAEQQIGGLVGFVQGETKTTSRKLLGSERTGQESHYTVSLLGETLPHTVRMFPVTLDDRTVVVFVQVADEDLADTTAGFDTILDSLAVE